MAVLLQDHVVLDFLACLGGCGWLPDEVLAQQPGWLLQGHSFGRFLFLKFTQSYKHTITKHKVSDFISFAKV